MISEKLLMFLSILYLSSQVIIPLIGKENMDRYTKYECIDWTIERGKLRSWAFYFKLIYFIPFILVWVIFTLLFRLIKFTMYKKESND